ncbi:MAG TPA: hypothetical protein VGC29_06580 [Flavisolibacter sp.]
MKQLVLFSILILILGSCKRKWTEERKSEFMAGCLSNAVRDSLIGERYARAYCDCILDRVVKKYPDAGDVNYIKYDTAIITISRSCLQLAKTP